MVKLCSCQRCSAELLVWQHSLQKQLATTLPVSKHMRDFSTCLGPVVQGRCSAWATETGPRIMLAYMHFACYAWED